MGPQTFGAELKAARKRAQLTQNQLATLLGAEMQDAFVTFRNIQNWEHNRSLPGDRTIFVALVKVLFTQKGLQTDADITIFLRAGNQGLLHRNEAGDWAPAPSLAESRDQNRLRHRDNPAPFLVPGLPLQGVFGRQNLMDTVSGLLLSPAEESGVPSPVCLTGFGGMGKTTVAIALGHDTRIRTNFPDGILWTAVGPKPNVRALLIEWGHRLGLTAWAAPDEATYSARIREIIARKALLLVIDDLWSVEDGKHFFVAGERSRTLFTTREGPVATHFALHNYRVRVTELENAPAQALMVKLVPELITIAPGRVADLCERFNNFPLALTLAGRHLATEADIPSRLQTLIDELMERPDARLFDLVVPEGRLGLEEGPVTLHAILGLSVERLSRDDQERFAMLSLFADEVATWDRRAVLAVWDCQERDADKTLSSFIQRGLIERRGERFWMHALLGDYASWLRREWRL
jgi:transcriptional regulator with XRE-family HTH domain